MTLLRIPTTVSAAGDRPASYGNQTICSTRPSCSVQTSTVDVINIAADHQMFMTLTGELSWQRLRRSAVDFYSKKRKKIAFWATLSGLRGNVSNASIASWKARGRLYIRHNWTFFRYLLRLRRYKRKSVEVGVFRRGWIGQFERRFQREGSIAHQPLLVSSSRVIVLSCGIKISALGHLDLSQSMRVTDRRTDRRTELRLPRPPSHMLAR